jgi:hypothetical protein
MKHINHRTQLRRSDLFAASEPSSRSSSGEAAYWEISSIHSIGNEYFAPSGANGANQTTILHRFRPCGTGRRLNRILQLYRSGGASWMCLGNPNGIDSFSPGLDGLPVLPWEPSGKTGTTLKELYPWVVETRFNSVRVGKMAGTATQRSRSHGNAGLIDEIPLGFVARSRGVGNQASTTGQIK